MITRFKFIILMAVLWLANTESAKAVGEAKDLIINEIQVANIDGFIDLSYNYGGWVEFYNPTDESIRLGTLYVSDDSTNLKRHRLLSTLGYVPAHGYKNIWFDHYDRGNKYSQSAAKQVDFQLDYDGGTIYVSNGTDIILSQTYPPAVQRCSYARTTDGGDEWRLCSTPTPEASNDGSSFADVQLEAPVVDTDGKLFTSAFDVHVAIPEGATLRFTVDGSTPTLENGLTSSDGTFSISQSTVLRLRLFKEGYLPSAVVTRSYLYRDRDYYLPIVSVVTDNKNLYDNKIGCYTVGTNGTSGNGISTSSNKNRSWERPVNFEYLVPEGDDDGGSFLMALNQECDFEVCGGWSRNLYGPNASFRLKGNKYYLEQKYLPYSFFSEKPYIRSKSVVVRNGGNDGDARIRDAATHRIILRSGFYVDCQECQPVHVFINGNFQFTFNLREPNHKHHGYANYGYDPDEMDQFEINGSVGYEQKTGDDKAFRQWMSLATQLAKKPEDASIYAQICDLVDIDEYCNYMAVECYVGCGDWLTNSNNVKGYRSRNDGKFHLVFMDLDSGFGTTNMLGSLAGKLSDSRYDTGKNFLIDIFLNMLKHEPFQKRFIDAFCLINGSVFEEEFSTAVAMGLRDERAKAAGFEGKTSSLNSSTNTLINGINSGRTSRMSSFRSYFGLKDPITIELASNIEGATLLANGQEVPRGQFKGSFHAPMVIQAKAPEGYRFVGWQQTREGTVIRTEKLFGINDEWTYYDQGSLDGKNWKSRLYSAKDWQTGKAPLGYGAIGINGTTDYQTLLDYGDDPDNKRPTYYFRKTFDLSAKPQSSDSYVLNGYVDDGCVVYVNGREIGRYLMADGTPTYSTFSTTYVGATAGKFSFSIDNTYLREGQNVVAVEVHNTHEHSSDIYWTGELVHTVYGENTMLSTDPELNLEAYQGTSLPNIVAIYEPLADEELVEELAMPLRVNELSAGNSVFVNEYFKRNDWIELYNTTDTELNAAGLYISDDLSNPYKYQIPASATVSTMVPAHGHLVIWADKLQEATQLHVPFKLSNDKNEAVLITSSDEFLENNAAFFAEHPALANFADGIIYDAHSGDQSVGRYPDGSNELYLFTRPSIGRQNSLLTADTWLKTDEGFGYILNPTSPGDVNNDGYVDLTDAIMIVYHALGQEQTDFVEAAADVNEDGEIDLTDAIIVVYTSLGAQ